MNKEKKEKTIPGARAREPGARAFAKDTLIETVRVHKVTADPIPESMQPKKERNKRERVK